MLIEAWRRHYNGGRCLGRAPFVPAASPKPRSGRDRYVSVALIPARVLCGWRAHCVQKRSSRESWGAPAPASRSASNLPPGPGAGSNVKVEKDHFMDIASQYL